MLITRLKLKNWRNFPDVDVPLGHRVYVIGANASGKSNLLDVFRFLRTVAQSDGGGLQKAIKERGGMKKLRSLHARKDTEVRFEVELRESIYDETAHWRYVLAFKPEGTGKQRVLITEESAWCDGKKVMEDRPNSADRKDTARLTQTHLEQINNNAEFRELAEHFAATTYLHLVPQLLKHADEISGRLMENDPFGQGLLQRIAATSKKVGDARLRRIQTSLDKSVPLFSELRFVKNDEVTGAPHLEARFKHWREHGAWQREDQFSDGTLRLIGLLWALQDGDGTLLLEEPELSLNEAIVERIPLMLDRVLRDRKKGVRQVLVSTHSEKLVASLGDASSVLLLEPGDNGTRIRPPDADEMKAMEHGLNPAEVLLPKTRPLHVEQMGLFV
ncbi:MAG: AAA family ATPase [Sulfuritalea sp.]|nr:AAA family ATPase [Sulfuritalea sp.]